MPLRALGCERVYDRCTQSKTYNGSCAGTQERERETVEGGCGREGGGLATGLRTGERARDTESILILGLFTNAVPNRL